MIIIIEPTLKKISFRAFGKKGISTFEWKYEWAGIPFRLQALVSQIAGSEPLEAFAFRLHFGGSLFTAPVRIDAGFPEELARLSGIFPLYIPPACKLIRLFYQAFKEVPQFAFFETSFFSGLPLSETTYPLKNDCCDKSVVAKYGFHGIFHEAHAGLVPDADRIISVVLDRHTTVCAIHEKKPAAVSLGCTPLEGIMSSKSCGDIDPGIIVYLMKEKNVSPYRIDKLLKTESGFYGMTGYDLPPDDLIKFYGKDEKVTLAFSVYKNQILKYIGDYIALLHGFDALVFAGQYAGALGQIIYEIAKDISFLGISLGALPWDVQQPFSRITSGQSAKHIYLNTQDETDIIYHEMQKFLPGTRAGAAA